MLITLVLHGGFLALSGSPALAAMLTLAMQSLFVWASNAKRAVLGEALLFSDFALISSVFRHPQFYLSALKGWQKACAVLTAAALVACLAWFFVPSPAPHIDGAATCLIALFLLMLSLKVMPTRRLVATPGAEAAVAQLGLLPAILIYWLRWRESADPPPFAETAHLTASVRPSPKFSEPELIVAVQCESFADPAELFRDPAFKLSGLESARAEAWQWGNLLVSGFGAYTMRTEYGVLFGREEEVLGFRQYDPFLTARGEASYALPHRLGTERWRSLFVHPHDMRFYGRDQILPAAGFAELVGEEQFDPPSAGRYVKDAAITGKILTLAEAASRPTFIYAVTIENHGPWSTARGNKPDQLVRNYNQLVREGDIMLTRLREGLAGLRRPALLVFFGDHRPSIPGACEPGGARHTPYVVLRFDGGGQIVKGDDRRIDITPARLHHAILEAVRGEPVADKEVAL